jgi:acyl-coenzyme A synthetase/AMP-(fatty) acid ligase
MVLHDSDSTLSYRELAFFHILQQVPPAFVHLPCQMCESSAQQHVMYCMFTSGSTGPPRGVFGTFAGFLNRIDWAKSHPILAFAETDVGCCVTSNTFVDYFAQVFEALLAGCPVVLFARNVILSGQLLLERIVHHKITRLTAVPSLLKGLIRFSMSTPDSAVAELSLRCIISSGEALFRRTALELLQLLTQCEIFNVYGTTEVAADCAFFHVNKHSLPDSEIVPIGFALPGFQLFLRKVISPVKINFRVSVCYFLLIFRFRNRMSGRKARL